MARRLAASDITCCCPTCTTAPAVTRSSGRMCWNTAAPSMSACARCRTKMTIPPVMDDVAAMLAFVDRQEAAKAGPVGAHGYCMSGPYALAAAARYPDRVAAAASFYGTWLVSDAVESPHLNSRQGQRASSTSACAEHRRAGALPMVERIARPVRELGQSRRARDVSGRPSRLRLPAALVLRQAGGRAALGASDRAVPPSLGLSLVAGSSRGEPRTSARVTDRGVTMNQRSPIQRSLVDWPWRICTDLL